jgi:hypothetical protein
MKHVTYWLNRKAYRDSVNYGTVCPSDSCLSLGDSIWTRTVEGKDGIAIWDTLKTTRLANGTLVIDTWDNSNPDRVVLADTTEVVC